MLLFWSTQFASILNSSVLFGNYLQQTTSADNIFRCIFFLGTLRAKSKMINTKTQDTIKIIKYVEKWLSFNERNFVVFSLR